MANFKACQKLTDNDKRLACFDALMPASSATALKEIVPTARSASSNQPTPSARPPQKEEFGTESLRSNQDFSDRQSATEEPDELKTKLISITVQGRKNVFTFDNGQVWKQHPSDTKRPMRSYDNVDAAVTIKKKLFGRHTMRYKGRTIQITRVQ